MTVRLTRDATGRFPERPFYTERELDELFEHVVVGFLRRHRGRDTADFPIQTDELTALIEEDASDIDTYADLSAYGLDVEGMTEFRPGEKPRVAIAAALSGSAHRENRHRTTLAHEYGHVRLHAYLFELRPPGGLLLEPGRKANAIYCKRQTMLSASKADWMEWQAGYACGAVLMPRTRVRRVAGEYREAHRLFGAVAEACPHGRELIATVAAAFDVSGDAARVRLLRLGVLGEPAAVGSLFG